MTLDNLKYIIGHLMEELDDAKAYAKWALRSKNTDKGFADNYKNIAMQELTHGDILAAQAQQIVNANKNDVAMNAIWDWAKEKYLSDKKEARMIIDMYM